MSEIPNWALALLEDPEEYDSEHGRSCHFCGSTHGGYDKPLEHYINCAWLVACREAGVAVDPTGHTVYEPTPCPRCETCGWFYNSPDDWQGREMPEPATEEMSVAHDTHVAEEHGITYEEFLAGPPGMMYVFNGPMTWHQVWLNERLRESFASIDWTARGGISYLPVPDLSTIREPDA